MLTTFYALKKTPGGITNSDVTRTEIVALMLYQPTYIMLSKQTHCGKVQIKSIQHNVNIVIRTHFGPRFVRIQK